MLSLVLFSSFGLLLAVSTLQRAILEQGRQCAQSLSCVQLFVTPWTVALKAVLSIEFFRQEYWSRLPFPTPGDLPEPGIKPPSLASLALTGRFSSTVPLGSLMDSDTSPIKELIQSDFMSALL